MVINNKLYNLLFKDWFRTKGRSSRQEYILRFSMMWVFFQIGQACIEIQKQLSIINYYDSYIVLISTLVFLSTIVVLFFLSVVQVFFVTHRRLHDLNASGWWQLVTFIPFGQILMIGFIFFKGTDGRNKYGEPPSY